ncbi:phytoene/squalene synthase family protein [Streptomyces tendae]|uniref:phytoene/squalene synthase family protein n=1 Tax=Streptomyces tendae TaxID=1932 RepID=UPI001166F757
MTRRELDAAGITDPRLRAAYTRCRLLNARHGRTYFLATRLLPADRRPAVHALYGFARWADDIVDDTGAETTPAERAAALTRLDRLLRQALTGGGPADEPVARTGGGPADRPVARTGGGPTHEPVALTGAEPTDEPVVLALADTADRYAIEAAHFTDFMASMRADLTVTDYATYADLRAYMHGSAAVIGLQMLPVLGTVTARALAAPHAAALGVAFQLTNFLRDVGEDLDRGRVYLPADLLAAHGVHRDLLLWSRHTGRRDPRVTAALRAAEDLTRAVYREAEPGLAMLDPVARPCIRTAYLLYRNILDAIAESGYAVLHRRAVVSRRRRASVAADGLVRVLSARLGARRARTPAPAPCGALDAKEPG